MSITKNRWPDIRMPKLNRQQSKKGIWFLENIKPGEELIQNRKLAPAWKGLYQVVKCNNNGSYRLQDFEGKILARTRNNVNLQKKFP